jgi:hypothetical protein
MKQVMSFIEKQIPCQNLDYSVLGIINIKKCFILSTSVKFSIVVDDIHFIANSFSCTSTV